MRISVPLILVSNLLLWGCGINATNSQGQQNLTDFKSKSVLQKEDQEFTKYNIMPEGDYTKLALVKQSIKKNKSISDADLSWLISLLHVASSDKGVVYAKVLLTFCSIRDISATQRNTILQATYPLLSSYEATDKNDFARLYGVKVLETMKRQSSIPYLVPLLSDPNPRVVESTKQAISELRAPGNAL